MNILLVYASTFSVELKRKNFKESLHIYFAYHAIQWPKKDKNTMHHFFSEAI